MHAECEQKLQAASDLKVQMAGMEQEMEALTQEKAELQAKVGRTEQKLRKVTAERCAPQPLIILHKLQQKPWRKLSWVRVWLPQGPGRDGPGDAALLAGSPPPTPPPFPSPSVFFFLFFG